MISKNIEKFRATGNILFIIKAIIQAFQQGRVLEIIHGIYYSIMYSPSFVKPCDNNKLESLIDEFKVLWYKENLYLTREKLIHVYGKDFLISSLPVDFAGARSQTIVSFNEFLIVGEYGIGIRLSRIAIITSSSCFINNYYTNYSSIIHIHAIYKCQNSNEVMVTTGDSSKFLDLWKFIDGNLIFVKRIRNRLAGYTAITKIDDEYYFGTDFSDRPNYIETLKRKKFFYPTKSYKEWVLTFYILSEKYLLSINKPILTTEKTVSIFDTIKKEFILCEKLDCILGKS